MAERKGLLEADDYRCWRHLIIRAGALCLASHQLEAAKCSFLRILDFPGSSASDHMHALESMARCHKSPNEWDIIIEYCEKAVLLLPEGKKSGNIGLVEERLLILLADGAEAKGNAKLSREYDDKATKLVSKTEVCHAISGDRGLLPPKGSRAIGCGKGVRRHFGFETCPAALR